MDDIEYFDEAALRIASEVAAIVTKKQHDYGPDNILKCPVGPERGIGVRIYDKLARLDNLIEKGVDPKNESLIDTANDIIGYGIVLKMVLEGSFTNPLND